MGLFDKIKNALFEEEYVEIEEPPKMKSVKKSNTIKKDSSKTKPIAKKIVMPEKVEVKNNLVSDDSNDNVHVSDREILKDTNNLKFPMMEDKDFRMEDNSYSYNHDEPKIVKVIDSDVEYRTSKPYDNKYDNKYNIDDSYEKVSNKNNDNIVNKKSLYGGTKENDVSFEHGVYEKKKDSSYFKPSPIISPIYGILDKNYKKDEIVNKREVRITSSYARENLSVEDVRRKAFGSLSDDLEMEMDNSSSDTGKHEVKTENDTNLLVDLSDDSPNVNEVTVGDAEEYFQDLGLEYNVDYKDASRNITSDVGKHEMKENIVENQMSDVKSFESNDEVSVTEADSDDGEDNLFDLIDSMYDKDN